MISQDSLHLHSFIMSEVKQLFMYLQSFVLLFLRMVFAHFSTGFLVFLFLISRSSLSIRESGSFSVILFVKIFHYESNFKGTIFLCYCL